MSDTPDMAFVPWAWIKLGAVVAAVLVIAGVAFGRCSAPDPAPLPAPVQKNVDRHLAQHAADSATIVLLAADTVAMHQTIVTLTDSAAKIDTAARISGNRADAAAARSDWHAAYVERTHEADQFQRELLVVTSKALLLGQQKTTASTIGDLYHAEAQLGDVIIGQLVPLAEQRDRCRILWIAHCPTRKQVFVGGVLAGVTGYAIVTGKIKIPIALRF